MAVTVTKTALITTNDEFKTVKKYEIAWTSDASGDASGTTGGLVSGHIVRVVFKPGTAGSQPSAAYDVTLTDSYSVDVLTGLGANLSNSTTTDVCPGVEITDGTTTSIMPVAVCDILTLTVANAGNTKSGTVVLYVS